MAWFEIPVRHWVEAEDIPTALDDIIDSMPNGRIIETGEARELSTNEVQSLTDFQAELDQSIKAAAASTAYSG